MFTDIVGRLNEMRGRGDIPSDLLDTLIRAFGQCQAELVHRGPAKLSINNSESEQRGLGNLGFPPLFVSQSQLTPDQVHGALNVSNGISYYDLPTTWAEGDDAFGGKVQGAMNAFFQGVNVFAPIKQADNPKHAQQQICVIVQGDQIVQNIHVGDTIFANNISISGTLDLSGVANYNGSVQQVLTHTNAGVLRWEDTEECP